MKRALRSIEIDEESEIRSDEEFDSRRITVSLETWFSKHFRRPCSKENWSVHFGLSLGAVVFVFQKY